MNISLRGKFKITLKLVLSCIGTSCRSLIFVSDKWNLGHKNRGCDCRRKASLINLALTEIARNFALGQLIIGGVVVCQRGMLRGNIESHGLSISLHRSVSHLFVDILKI